MIVGGALLTLFKNFTHFWRAWNSSIHIFKYLLTIKYLHFTLFPGPKILLRVLKVCFCPILMVLNDLINLVGGELIISFLPPLGPPIISHNIMNLQRRCRFLSPEMCRTHLDDLIKVDLASWRPFPLASRWQQCLLRAIHYYLVRG
jgi:hypothetical protein